MCVVLIVRKMSYRIGKGSHGFGISDHEYMIDIDSNNDHEDGHAGEVTDNTDEDSTPVLRPWSKKDTKKAAKPINNRDYDPSLYISGSERSHDSKDKSPFSESSDDKDSVVEYHAAEPLTPSRLLTLNSFDFSNEDVLNESNGDDTKNEDDTAGIDKVLGSSNIPHSPILSPLAPKEINDDALKKDIKEHCSIISEYSTQLTLSIENNITGVIRKLLHQKETELRGRDAFYTKELQKQQIIIEDLEEVVATYEKNILLEEADVRKYRQLVESITTKLCERYFSPFSVTRLFQHWCIFTSYSKKMSKKYELACKHRRKTVLRVSLSAFQIEASKVKAERRGNEENRRFDKTIRDLVSRYEKQISLLTQELKESQECLSQEKCRRQQLEEDLRRLFLKNMTVMNMEALSLFQTPVVAPPELAEFGHDKKRHNEMLQTEAAQQRQQSMITQMRKQQKQLQSHRSKQVNMQSCATQKEAMSRKERVSSQSESSSYRNDSIRSEDWEDEEEYPRVSPHLLPYSGHKK